MHYTPLRVITTCFVIIASTVTFAQENDAIRSWVLTHPNVTLIEQQNFNQLSESQLSKLQQPYVVFNEPLSIEQLNHFDNLNPTISDTHKEDAEAIKLWLATHQNLKQIKQSEFKNFRNEDQEYYLNDIHSIVLSGEEISLIDIKNYETNHPE